MNEINKTLYIPLYGKAMVSSRGIILKDPKAEEICSTVNFKLKRRSKSKWLAYLLSMRAAVIDQWLQKKISSSENAIILHIGCGLDSRIERVGNQGNIWYDADFPDVIKERARFYQENDQYHMLAIDARKISWAESLPPADKMIIVMEGVSMYVRSLQLRSLLFTLAKRYPDISILMDCYTEFGAKMSKYRNPVHEVGVYQVSSIGIPESIEVDGIRFLQEHDMTPQSMIDELKGFEKFFFKKVYAGRFAKKVYRLYEYGPTAVSGN